MFSGHRSSCMPSSSLRRGALLLALAVPFVLTNPSSLSAQATTGTVRGHVTDAVSGRGVPQAQVTITATRIGVLTGEQVDFTLLSVPPDPRTAEARPMQHQ